MPELEQQGTLGRWALWQKLSAAACFCAVTQVFKCERAFGRLGGNFKSILMCVYNLKEEKSKQNRAICESGERGGRKYVSPGKMESHVNREKKSLCIVFIYQRLSELLYFSEAGGAEPGNREGYE